MTEPRIIQNFLGYRAFVVSEAQADVTQAEAYAPIYVRLAYSPS